MRGGRRPDRQRLDALTGYGSPGGGASAGKLDLLTAGLVAAALVAVAVTFAPWHHSGSATRNSYELLASADRLGIVEGSLNRVLAVAWPLVPLTMALGGVGLALGRRVLGAVLVMAGAVLEVLGAAIVLRADTSLRWGVGAALLAGLITTALALTVILRVRTMPTGA